MRDAKEKTTGAQVQNVGHIWRRRNPGRSSTGKPSNANSGRAPDVTITTAAAAASLAISLTSAFWCVRNFSFPPTAEIKQTEAPGVGLYDVSAINIKTRASAPTTISS